MFATSQNVSPSIYTGGNDDGFSLISTAAQNPSPSIYNGGVSDGIAIVLVSQQNASPSIYAGGANDGWATITVTRQNSSNPLPLRLLSFTGRWQNDDALLSWSTADEQGLDHYDLERSQDGVSFEKISYLLPKSARANQYQYLDFNAAALPSGHIFYRLRMVSQDGTYSYSDIVPLKRGPTAARILLYPNPNSGSFTLLLDDKMLPGDVRYVIASPSGQVVQQGRVLSSATRYDISSLAAGVYIFSCLQNGQVVQSFKVVYTR